MSNLPKYDESGNAWLYYMTETAIRNVTETAIQNGSDDLFLKYGKDYRDKNNYRTSGAFTYSGGSLTNTRTSLTISKTVTGNMSDKSKTFRFTLTLWDGDTAYSGEVEYAKGNSAVSAQTSDFMEITDGAVSFPLGNADWITFLDLPVYLSYSVSENGEDAVGYETTYSINSASAVVGLTASGTLSDIPVVEFVNKRGSVIPTGISLNSPIWAPMTLLSWGGLLLLLRMKRGRKAQRMEQDFLSAALRGALIKAGRQSGDGLR